MLPDGISLGRLQGQLSTLASISPHFTGAVRITEKGGGTGFVLFEAGNPYAAAFEDKSRGLLLGGDDAYRHFLERPSLVYELIAYTAEETRAAREASSASGCLVTGVGRAPPSPEKAALQQIVRQPGVVAVSVFHEGFALQSVGSADFEKVAAVAEDLLRAGSQITAEMDKPRPDPALDTWDAGEPRVKTGLLIYPSSGAGLCFSRSEPGAYPPSLFYPVGSTG